MNEGEGYRVFAAALCASMFATAGWSASEDNAQGGALRRSTFQTCLFDGAVACAAQAPAFTRGSLIDKRIVRGAQDRRGRNIVKLHERYKFDEGEVAGTGGFGIVRRAVCRKTGKVVALKIMGKHDVSRADFDREFMILSRLSNHRNINKLIDCFETAENWVLVLEFCEGGELFDRLLEEGEYSERRASEMLRKICKAISHIHAVAFAESKCPIASGAAENGRSPRPSE